MNQNQQCKVCKIRTRNLNEHINSIDHRFNFKIWSLKRYRKALFCNKEDIVVTINPIKQYEGMQFHNGTGKKFGKYTTQIPITEGKNGSRFVFRCKMKNNNKEAVIVTPIESLESSAFYSINDFNGLFSNNQVISLRQGEAYEVNLVFSLETLCHISSKNTLAFNFVKNGHDFSICRSMVVVVSENCDYNIGEDNPFLGEVWRDINEIKPPENNNNGRSDRYVAPDWLKQSKSKDLLHRIERCSGNVEANYQEFWHLVLWMEELVQCQMVEKYNMSDVNFTVKNDNIVVLEVPGLQEKRPSLVPNDIVEIRTSKDHTVYQGIIKFTREKTIEIQNFNKELFFIKNKYPEYTYDVRFSVGRLSFERMHEGIDKISKNGLKSILFPTTNIRPDIIYHDLTNDSFINPQIANNPEQKKAVIKILNSRQVYPYIVFGPPGTGKTITIVEAILQIKKLTPKKILVCAPSNTACDVIAEKLMPHCKSSELIRIHSKTRDVQGLSEEARSYSNLISANETKKIMLNNYRIIVTTLTLIGRYGHSTYSPDYIFIDEAANASEPECAIAIGFLNKGNQLVLAGDHLQLGPMVCCQEENFPLKTSLLQRLLNYPMYKSDDNFYTMLRQNFRSHEKILHIPNILFYGSRLISMYSEMDLISDVVLYYKVYPNEKVQPVNECGTAIEFVAVNSKEKREGCSPSFFNPIEVDTVTSYVKNLMSLPKKYAVTQDAIGIITPYIRQVYKIKASLKKIGYDEIEVGTTEAFQGKEKRIIIISTVRAQHAKLRLDKKYNMGFVKNDQRFNVAITRAKSKLIIIGCPHVLCQDAKWLQLMQYCESNNSYYGEKYQIRNSEFKYNILRRLDHVNHP